MASVTTPAAQTSLRERKKIRTRRAIRSAAYRLFEDQGYDETTVEQIAAAAEVSPSTFFRYFPTKEDVVLSDEYDPMMEAAIAARPAGEPIVETMRLAVVELLRRMVEEDRREILYRLRLARSVPAIRIRLGENLFAAGKALAGAIAQRSGDSPDDLELRVVMGALLGGWSEALMHWADTDGAEPLPDLLDRTLAMMTAGLATGRPAAPNPS